VHVIVHGIEQGSRRQMSIIPYTLEWPPQP